MHHSETVPGQVVVTAGASQRQSTPAWSLCTQANTFLNSAEGKAIDV